MMTRVHRLFRCAGVALLSGAAAVTFAQSVQTIPKLDVKPGLWEMSMTSSMNMSGAPPMDTSKMTAEQRAGMEAAMKGMMQPRTDVQKQCITREEMAKSFLQNSGESCTDTVTANTSTRFDMTRSCTGSRTTTTTAHMESVTRESVKGTIDISAATGDRAQKVALSFTGKWLAADCGTVK